MQSVSSVVRKAAGPLARRAAVHAKRSFSSTRSCFAASEVDLRVRTYQYLSREVDSINVDAAKIRGTVEKEMKEAEAEASSKQKDEVASHAKLLDQDIDTFGGYPDDVVVVGDGASQAKLLFQFATRLGPSMQEYSKAVDALVKLYLSDRLAFEKRYEITPDVALTCKNLAKLPYGLRLVVREMASEGTLEWLPPMKRHFDSLLSAQGKVLPAVLRVTSENDAKSFASLQQKIQNSYFEQYPDHKKKGYKLQWSVVVDPSLFGGFTAQIGKVNVLNESHRAKLGQMVSQLAKDFTFVPATAAIPSRPEEIAKLAENDAF